MGGISGNSLHAANLNAISSTNVKKGMVRLGILSKHKICKDYPSICRAFCADDPAPAGAMAVRAAGKSSKRNKTELKEIYFCRTKPYCYRPATSYGQAWRRMKRVKRCPLSHGITVKKEPQRLKKTKALGVILCGNLRQSASYGVDLASCLPACLGVAAGECHA